MPEEEEMEGGAHVSEGVMPEDEEEEHQPRLMGFAKPTTGTFNEIPNEN